MLHVLVLPHLVSSKHHHNLNHVALRSANSTPRYINDGGLGDIAGSQSNAMDSAGAPNDLLGNFNPITVSAIARQLQP